MKKIINVTPGLIPIPPNGWGAVEKIIWETHLSLKQLGYESEILYLNDISNDADIVHIHVANLANEAHLRGIKYYFTMHDHHAFLYGKDSDTYKENLKAIRNAEKAFVPAKYLVDWFEGIPEYFSHGVNTEFFKNEKTPKYHKLLCVANNGFIHNQSEDRKGFGIAIEAAKSLGLPITIVGPENNKKYFEKFPSDYKKLTIKYNLSETELLEIYKEHSIFLHPSVLEAGHPNLTLLEAMSCGLPVLATFENKNKLDGLIKIERTLESVLAGIAKVFSNYNLYSNKARQQAIKLSWKNRTKELLEKYNIKDVDENKLNMKDLLIKHYNQTEKIMIPSKNYKPNVIVNNIDGAFLEILGDVEKKYDVKFINKKTNEVEYELSMSNNNWARCSIKYFVDWKIVVKEGNDTVYEYNTDYSGKTVYIALDSKSLGDTLAWFPYVDEFRKKHNCSIICSTFWNDFFESEYPHFKFIKPGEVANGIIAMYTIGIFYDSSFSTYHKLDTFKHPNNPIKEPLQKIASDILGLDYFEIKPKMKKFGKKTSNKKYVAIGFHSTAQLKYWNNPTGWDDVCNYLKSNGLEPIIISKEGPDYMGNRYPKNVDSIVPKDIDEAIEIINGSEFFIGISSGLSWLSWALGKKTILISGFTDADLEFQDCIRVINKSVCTGCWGRYKFNAGDWNWCPDHKGTHREFECSKAISSEMVINSIKKLVENS